MPITDKTIFRLSSLTKAITSVVAMQLIQDGKIKLDDPVSKYITTALVAKRLRIQLKVAPRSQLRSGEFNQSAQSTQITCVF